MQWSGADPNCARQRKGEWPGHPPESWALLVGGAERPAAARKRLTEINQLKKKVDDIVAEILSHLGVDPNALTSWLARAKAFPVPEEPINQVTERKSLLERQVELRP